MQFSEDQIAEFQETFLLYDQRGDGRIPVSQIGKSRAKSTKMFRIHAVFTLRIRLISIPIRI
jgi:Ca2+-binding EF-hand superfamily protein